MKYRIVQKGDAFKIQKKSFLFWVNVKQSVRVNGVYDFEYNKEIKWYSNLQQAKNAIQAFKNIEAELAKKEKVVWEE